VLNVFRSRIEIKSVVVVLIIVNVVVFLLTQYTSPSLPFSPRAAVQGRSPLSLMAERYGLFITLFSLFPAMIAQYGWVWQFVTYMFLHGSMLHLFFNMYALLLFGRALEEKWGWKRFTAFYLVTGVGAGVVTFFWNLARNPFIPTIGASGAIFGVMLAFGLEFPDVLLLLFFVVPIRARFAVFIYGGLELVLLLTGSMQRVGHFTHLAGLLFGYLYYLIGIRPGFGGRGPRGTRGRRPRVLKPTDRPVGYRQSGPRFRGFLPGVGRSGASRPSAAFAGDSGKRRDESRAARDIELALALKDRIRKADPLSRAETVFLLKLKKAFDENGGGICDPTELDLTAESCRSCEDFHACLYRFLIGTGS
jgi:membrane associated rhomboid family serine protease